MPDRWDTSFESEGAEFLVLGSLLTKGIVAFKAYGRTPNYDIAATGLARQKSYPSRIARISVKSRYWTNASGSVLKNLDFEFLVVVRLNKGDKHYRTDRKANEDATPEFFVLPVNVIEERWRKPGGGAIRIGRPSGYLEYKDRWDLIVKFLRKVH